MQMDMAANMMKFDSVEELRDYIDTCRDDWIVNTSGNGSGHGSGEELCFQPPDAGAKASDIPSKKLIAQTLSYATEFERIV